MWPNRVKLLKSAALPSFRIANNGHCLSVGGIRGYAGRGPCAPDNQPRCSPEKMKDVKCVDPRENSWFDPRCCPDPCPDSIARFDDIYYKPNMKRRYTRTWVDCPDKIYAMKKVCCLQDVKPPPFERRPAKSHHGKECTLTADTARYMKCQVTVNKKCPKVTWPGCKQARDPPRCFHIREPTNCKKRCTPYPSYSECNKPAPKPRHPIECKCLEVGTVCFDPETGKLK